MLTIGQAMKKARLSAGVSRRVLAEAAGIHPQSLVEYELDRHAPGVFALVSLADALGLTIDEYIGHEVKERSVEPDEP